jgi:hypothetical protein
MQDVQLYRLVQLKQGETQANLLFILNTFALK